MILRARDGASRRRLLLLQGAARRIRGRHRGRRRAHRGAPELTGRAGSSGTVPRLDSVRARARRSTTPPGTERLSSEARRPRRRSGSSSSRTRRTSSRTSSGSDGMDADVLVRPARRSARPPRSASCSGSSRSTSYRPSSRSASGSSRAGGSPSAALVLSGAGSTRALPALELVGGAARSRRRSSAGSRGACSTRSPMRSRSRCRRSSPSRGAVAASLFYSAFRPHLTASRIADGARRQSAGPDRTIGVMELTPRKREILRRVVEEYVATGQPVGSKALVERSGLDVSSSTVRSELSELEAIGLLTHPHTSAGRIPTESGYRSTPRSSSARSRGGPGRSSSTSPRCGTSSRRRSVGRRRRSRDATQPARARVGARAAGGCGAARRGARSSSPAW